MFHLFGDPDTTQIDWGARRRQAGKLTVFQDRGTHSEEVIPEPIVGAKPMLLDAADIVAYCAAHIGAAPAKRKEYIDILQAFNAEGSGMQIAPSAFGAADT